MSNRLVKITKSINRSVGKVDYFKHIVTIPNKHMKDLGWTDKTELDMSIVRGKLVIKKK